MASPRETIELFQIVLRDAGFGPRIDGKWGPNTIYMMNEFGSAYQEATGTPMPSTPYPTRYIFDALSEHLGMSLAFTLEQLQGDIAAYEREVAEEGLGGGGGGSTPPPGDGRMPPDLYSPGTKKGLSGTAWLLIGLGVVVLVGGGGLAYYYLVYKPNKKKGGSGSSSSPYGEISDNDEDGKQLSWGS